VGHSLLTDGRDGQAGLNAVLSLYAQGAKNHLKKAVKEAWIRDHNYWTRRPLTQEMVDYASGDVRFLLKAYDRMAHDLQKTALLGQALSFSRTYVDQARLSSSSSAPSRAYAYHPTHA
jgi:ribonuclease D